MASRDKVREAIKDFSWSNYGLDEVEMATSDEWLDDLTDAVEAALE